MPDELDPGDEGRRDRAEPYGKDTQPTGGGLDVTLERVHEASRMMPRRHRCLREREYGPT
jgi:hypothetical protein